MKSEEKESTLVIGGRGEFGQFLHLDILPMLGVDNVLTIERETPSDESFAELQRARHVVLATPLAGYAELACELVYRCRDLRGLTTIWLIPSVQAGVWRAVTATLEIVANPFLSAVFVHPMYGPNGFRATEPEARTFQNILTATGEGREHPLVEEVANISEAFRSAFNITTTDAFNPEQHDRITAYSQGLSYCVARLMFEQSEVDTVLRENMPDLYHSFHANHDLILDFLRINAYMPQVIAAFAEARRQTPESTYEDVLRAFAHADKALNRGEDSPIPTKWYEKLRASASVMK
ncbi:MAG: prephenate dehydrogenase/arogenate dehydrogenase family protein [Pyrinomonadaceae bacterium]|nr:prephenate dehydrogenase/arogenate dehydrogenase family protein [Pyrinomonadaceae bacterium]